MLLQLHGFLNTPAGLLLLFFAAPVAAGILAWVLRGRSLAQLLILLAAGILEVLCALSVYQGGVAVAMPFCNSGMSLSFQSCGLSQMLLLLLAVMFLLVGMYSVSYFFGNRNGGLFLLFYCISLAMANGALLADHMGVMLFFWEGLLCTLFGILLIDNLENPKTAVKALVLSGAADLLLMAGIVITVHVAGTPFLSQMQGLSLEGAGMLGCVCLILGAVGKAGAMPFHSWIPNAAKDAPTPFLAAFPGSLEKVVGLYLLARVIHETYAVEPGGEISIFVMVLGAVTLFFGVCMALIQKDMKGLLSFHAISQVGYMILGIGTAMPVGILGGLFHLLNNALYKTGLFMAAGAVERATGTTDLHNISGLGRRMPVTMVCFVIFGLSIAGFPMTNGFFSKELIFDAAIISGVGYYLPALIGAVMTALSFLKMGGAAFFGKESYPDAKKIPHEAGFGICFPMCVLAFGCILFGVWNRLPLAMMIQPAMGFEHAHAGWPESTLLVLLSSAALLFALANFFYGRKRTGTALGAADHIHYAPGLKQCYALAEKGKLDPYAWFNSLVNGFATVCQWIENGVSWVYDKGIPSVTAWVSSWFAYANNGSIARYLVVGISGFVLILFVFAISVSMGVGR